MTGSEMSDLVRPVALAICTALGTLFLVLGLVTTSPISTIAYLLAGVLLLLAFYLFLLGHYVTHRRKVDDAKERQEFAEHNPALHAALVKLEAICNGLPGYKRIRFHRSAEEGVNHGEAQLNVYVYVDGWSEADNKGEPISVGGMPIQDWFNKVPKELDGYEVEVTIFHNSISMGFVGGLGNGFWT